MCQMIVRISRSFGFMKSRFSFELITAVLAFDPSTRIFNYKVKREKIEFVHHESV